MTSLYWRSQQLVLKSGKMTQVINSVMENKQLGYILQDFTLSQIREKVPL